MVDTREIHQRPLLKEIDRLEAENAKLRKDIAELRTPSSTHHVQTTLTERSHSHVL